jgi:uncharacterized membrane protein HdeD (DUF308 family)
MHAPLDDHGHDRTAGAVAEWENGAPPTRSRDLEGAMGWMDATFEEREVRERAAGRWWVFLFTGIGWLIFALILFQWDYATVSAISYLFGVSLLVAAANEWMQFWVSTTGWRIVHAILSVLFTIGGIYALWSPYDTFATLAALIGFYFLAKGTYDLTVAFVTKGQFELWWLHLAMGLAEILLAFWVAGDFREKAILLVVYIGLLALLRGITELFLAFKLKALQSHPASV